jgi:hypothetical protein
MHKGACLFARVLYCGGMRPASVFTSLSVLAGVAVVGGAVLLGFRHTQRGAGGARDSGDARGSHRPLGGYAD